MANGFVAPLLAPSKRSEANESDSWAPFIGLVVTAIFCAAAWFLAPKGENQTYVAPCSSLIHPPGHHRRRQQRRATSLPGTHIHIHIHVCNLEQELTNRDSVWRSTLVLSAAAMYIMWAITFLAQLHPLISPIRNDLRPEYNQG